MKSKIQILLAMAFLLIGSIAYAQVPQLFNYQGIARDAKGNPLSNQTMTLKLSVLPTSDATMPEYEETQTVKTNEFGLYTLQIGNGNAVTGNMKTVKWETGNKYIKVAIDPTGGNNYVDAGTNQLLSVPYAIYADKAGIAANGGNDKTRTGAVNSEAAHVAGDAGYLTKFTALNTIGKSAFFQSAAGNIGLGTITPTALARLHIKQENPVGGSLEYLRMQNLDPNGFGKFIMYNDVASNYATFTKYGSTYPGGYPGPNVASQFPYANLLAFGNNTGPFLLSNNGNVGIGIVSAGNTVLKFNVTHPSGNVGIGGSATPATAVHFNNNAATETLLVTNNTTGHTAADGLEISNNGNAASIINKENSTLGLGTSNTTHMTIDAFGNVGVGTNTPTYKLDVTHGGSTGILSKSTGSFSVIDIDGASGDAALRFGNNGTLQWNTRNEPGSNDYQIFQMTGGGERLRINSATGNVGIGTSTAVARLHVLSDVTNDTAIYASANDGSATNQIGVLGTYNTSGYGAGIVGRGFGGSVPPVGAQDIGVYGSSSGIAMWSNGPMRISDGTQGAGKVLVSDASGNATWQQKTFSSAYSLKTADPVIDTTIDGTVYKRFIYNAPEITLADLSNATINCYFDFGAGPFPLPYTSGAGGSANTMMVLFAPGKIFLLRWTHATPGTASIGMSSGIQLRYVINRP